MTETRPTVLFDETEATVALLDSALHCPLTPLSEIRASNAPGVYALALTGAAPRWYRRRATDPPTLVYVGTCRSLSGRLSTHASTVGRTPGFTARVVGAVAVPLSAGQALYGERALQELLRPLWCEPWLKGFGSRSLGVHRVGQKASPWRVAHDPAPGSEQETMHLRERITSYLADNPGPIGGWPW